MNYNFNQVRSFRSQKIAVKNGAQSEKPHVDNDRLVELYNFFNGDRERTFNTMIHTRGWEFVKERTFHRLLTAYDTYGMKGLVRKARVRKGLSPSFEKAVAKRSGIVNSNGVLIANRALTYDCIRCIAKETQNLPEFQNDPKVQSLLFSNCWVAKYLDRNKVSKRRNTTDYDKIQSLNEGDIKSKLNEIKNTIVTNGYTKNEIINMDETGIYVSGQIKFQYVEDNNMRASVAFAGDKTRITAVVASTAAGNFLPVMIIVKNNCKTPDHTKGRVLDNLLREIGQGWTKKVWSKVLVVEVKSEKKKKAITFKSPYLINTSTGDIITANNKAWMNKVSMVMYAETTLTNYIAATNGSRMYCIMDNCPSHGVDIVLENMRAKSIKPAFLPPNTTSILQPMDLVVNKPLKNFITAKRSRRICDEQLNCDPADYKPLKPSCVDVIHDICEFLASKNGNSEFQSSIQNSFIHSGLAPNDEGQ